MELADDAYEMGRAEAPLRPCRVDTESVLHYLLSSLVYEQFCAPGLATEIIYSRAWNTSLISFLTDSGRSEIRQERKRLFRGSTLHVKTQNP